MKALVKIIGMGLIGSLFINGFSSNAAVQVSASVQINATADFYAPLGTLGTWVTVGSYGRCWHPSGVAVTWRPYCDGTWVWTDCGWYWESPEPWGWACYHYGRWVLDPGMGWIWVPDVEWAPAWVWWREGGGYIGWAPCPPAGVIVAPAAFAFVAVGNFHEPVRPTTVIVNNTTIINHTTVQNSFRHETRVIDGASRKIAVNDGPSVESVQKATGKTIATVPVQEAIRRTSMPSTMRPKAPAEQPGKAQAIPEQPKKQGLQEPPARSHSPEKFSEPPAPTMRSNAPGAPPNRDKNAPPPVPKRKDEEARPKNPGHEPAKPAEKPQEFKPAPGHEGPPKDKGDDHEKP